MNVKLTLALTAVMASAMACATGTRARPLAGVATEAAVALPLFELPDGHRRIAFKWELNDNALIFRGDGLARLAAPDSARVDLVMGGLFGGGASVTLIGDSTRVPPNATMTHLIPSAPLLWATFGRLAIPALPDTVIRMSGDTLRADIGSPAQWRVTAVNRALLRLERISDGRIVESVDRTPGKPVRYESANRRTLIMTLVRDDSIPGFDRAIWTY
jgi:hypothetical protein